MAEACRGQDAAAARGRPCCSRLAACAHRIIEPQRTTSHFWTSRERRRCCCSLARAFCFPSVIPSLVASPVLSWRPLFARARATTHCRQQRFRRHITASRPGRAVTQLTSTHIRASRTTTAPSTGCVYTSRRQHLLLPSYPTPPISAARYIPATLPTCVRFGCCYRSPLASQLSRSYCTLYSAISMTRRSSNSAVLLHLIREAG